MTSFMIVYESYSDLQLTTEISIGDSEAFEFVYWRYSRELHGYLRRNISRHQDCEEIVQDIFESLWIKRESLKIENLRAYLFATARFKIIDYFRHSAVKKQYESHYRLFEPLYEYSHDFEQQLDASAVESLIDQGISKLPPRCQDAVRMRLKENLSNHDIATRMNISLKTVQIHMRHAIRHLRESLPDTLQGKIISLITFLMVLLS